MKGSVVMEDKKPMNILIVGNGFDIAHGLPTRYGDFLDFLKCCKKIVDDNPIHIENEKSLQGKDVEEDWINIKDSKLNEVIKSVLESDEGRKIFGDKFIHNNYEEILKKNNIIDDAITNNQFHKKKCAMQIFFYFEKIFRNNVWCQIFCRERRMFENNNIRDKDNWIDIEKIIKKTIKEIDKYHRSEDLNDFIELLYFDEIKFDTARPLNHEQIIKRFKSRFK